MLNILGVKKRHPSGADQDLTYYGTLEKPYHGTGGRVLARGWRPSPAITKAAKTSTLDVIFGKSNWTSSGSTC